MSSHFAILYAVRFGVRLVLAAGILAAFPPSAGYAAGSGFDADNPGPSGYALSFDDEFDKATDIDIDGTGAVGYNWYTRQFFGFPTTRPDVVSVAGGVLTLSGGGNNNGSIETACPAANPQGYIGQVFGGGAYFEASLAFDPAVVDVKNGWPSFWSMGIEHMANKGEAHWPGQPAGYDHFAEDDFFEYDTAWAGASTYGGAVHDWWGIWTPDKGYSNVQNDNYIIRTPAGTDFTRFHRYGNLWTPASPGNDWQGSIQSYFDGQPTSDRITWRGDQFPGAPPPNGDFKFSIIDRELLNLLLGCGTGETMRVKYVRVWQKPDPPVFSAQARATTAAGQDAAVDVAVDVSCRSGWINPAVVRLELLSEGGAAAAGCAMDGRAFQTGQTQYYDWTPLQAPEGRYRLSVDVTDRTGSKSYFHAENLASVLILAH